MKLEELKKGMKIEGLHPSGPATIREVEPMGDLLEVIFRTSGGETLTEMLRRSDESRLAIVDDRLKFDADPADFKLGLEARRMQLSHFFDPMMAVHTSNIDPLPHQIDAVYGCMLPKLPLRFLLADDPGAGKTIMAGLLIQEMIVRGDAERILVVSPGGLAAQWRTELEEKFGLEFEIFESDWLDQQDPFDRHRRVVCRLDQISRQFPSQDQEPGLAYELFKKTEWDLVIVDEAHKMSAHWEGEDVRRSKRYRFGEQLSPLARHFLLMTATPHSGKEDDYQLFLCLLDGDRFYGKNTSDEAEEESGRTDYMRRMIKEKMVRFDGTPLFPLRVAKTVEYTLSPLELELYELVTKYVREQMDRADKLKGNKRSAVGFALAALQRRLASSPEAIYRSLQNRVRKLERQLKAEEVELRGGNVGVLQQIDRTLSDTDNFDETELDEAEQDLEVFELASAARTIYELNAEIEILKDLQSHAKLLVDAGEDRKWVELHMLVTQDALLTREDGSVRKLIVFSEFRSTLDYLVKRLEGTLGTGSVVSICGETNRLDRGKIQENFKNDSRIRVLVATDAAGEGVNLQCANLMVNYDLPWNTNRLEQRFGRIHRIGQREVCHLWNLLAKGTRESDVYARLLSKMDTESDALGGDIFNILGDLFHEESLQDLLLKAIRLQETLEVKQHFYQRLDGIFDMQRLRELVAKRALGTEQLSLEHLSLVHHEMEKAQARKLIPGYVKTYFEEAFTAKCGGHMVEREANRFEIRLVPYKVRDAAKGLASKIPVTEKYARICFARELVKLDDRETASLIHPGHPLFQAVNHITLESCAPVLSKGAFLSDPLNQHKEIRLLVCLEHRVCERNNDGTPSRVVSHRMQFAWVDMQGNIADAGWAPHLDLAPISEAQRAKVWETLPEAWPSDRVVDRVKNYATADMAQGHFDEVQNHRLRHVDTLTSEVKSRLNAEITRLWGKRDEFKQKVEQGKMPHLQLNKTDEKISELEGRLYTRIAELERQKNLLFLPPVVIGEAVVVPAYLLAESPGTEATFAADAAAKKHVESVAMHAVMDVERNLGFEVTDVSADKCGWDVTAMKRDAGGNITEERHIEVKGRAEGQTTVTVTKNEIIHAMNQAEKFLLAVVLVNGDKFKGPYYVKQPFDREPGWAEVSVNLDLQAVLSKAEVLG